MFPARLAHVTHWPLPSDDTATIQIVQTADALVRAGTPVDLVLPRKPGRATVESELRVAMRERYGTECAFGLRLVPSQLGSVQWLSHAIHAVLGSIAASPAHYDVLHTRDFETTLVALRLGRRVLFEAYRPLTRRSRWHRALLRNAVAHPKLLGLVTHSHLVAAKYATDGVPSAKLRAIHNGFDPKPYATERSPSEARALLGWIERPTVAYAGRLAPLKRIELLFAAAEQSPEIEWVLAGGTESDEARPLVARGRRLPNVRFPGFLRGERLALALQAADVLVLAPGVDAVRHPEQSGLPIKLFHYLAAGRPVVAPDLAEIAELVSEERNGVLVRPEDAAGFLAALRALLADPERRRRLGAGARATAAGYTWDARARALQDFLLERLRTAANPGQDPSRSESGNPA